MIRGGPAGDRSLETPRAFLHDYSASRARQNSLMKGHVNRRGTLLGQDDKEENVLAQSMQHLEGEMQYENLPLAGQNRSTCCGMEEDDQDIGLDSTMSFSINRGQAGEFGSRTHRNRLESKNHRNRDGTNRA